MTVAVKTPVLGESISEATVAKWLKKEGEFVGKDEVIAELETDKVNLEVNATAAGVLKKITVAAGGTVKVGQVMAEIDDAASAPAAAAAPAKATTTAKVEDLSPAVRKIVAENNIDPSKVQGTGRDGRLTKADVLGTAPAAPAKAEAPKAAPAPAMPVVVAPSADRREERVPMTRLRKTIASRLKEAQNTAAMLTTFNEVDLLAVNRVRQQYKDKFKEKYGVGLGYMSFFTKAAVAALKEIPALNAEIQGDDIIYKHYYDIGIAVSAPKGLVVPVVRNVDLMNFWQIEAAIAAYGAKAKENTLTPDDLSGGTFTITNGGVFGSMMSTPILNTPQVGILGMHAIKDRPVVVDGKVEVRPMMYLALSYDHRIVDGREAVTFLVRIKEALEDPARLMLGL
jgi:2-oxoglutarate dehydrogenase E2 component (dihydrolipoamide succinyltransferase)